MKENTFVLNFLGEEDFLEAMEGPCRQWREESVREGYLESFDGAKLHYYYAFPKNPAGCIVMVHGFCEFFGKYHETAWYFYRAGYGFYFLENRGHGYSKRTAPEMDVVDIDDYRTYMEDLHEFLDQVVVPGSVGLKRVLFAHSMGGGISAYFLEHYTDYFDYAILNSPMLKKFTDKTPEEILEMKQKMQENHTEKQLAPGQSHFSTIPSFETSSAQSKARFDYVFEQRLMDPHYQTKGASNQWVIASIELYDKIMAGADKIRTPMTVNIAGLDHLIDPEGYVEFKKRAVNDVSFVTYEDSRHELFSSNDSTRKTYYRDLFAILGKCFS